MPQKKLTRGFTLVELSIVLVIIGLIAGGILVGNDLIKAAKIRATVTQIDRYNAAANSFRVKYNYLPGDLPNSSVYGFTATDQATGDKGDDQIDDCGGTGVTFGCETDAFWTQLTATNLIADTLTDTTAQSAINASGFTTAAKLLPQAKLGTDGGQYMNYIYIAINTTGWTTLGKLNVNYFRIVDVSSIDTSGYLNIPGFAAGNFGLRGVDAAAIDTKMDDGNPANGIVLGYDNNSDVTKGATMYLSAAGSGLCQGAVAGNYNTAAAGVCNIAIKASF